MGLLFDFGRQNGLSYKLKSGFGPASARSVSEILFCLFCSKYISILKNEFALLLRDPQVLRKNTIFDHKKRTLESHRYIHTRYVIQLT